MVLDRDALEVTRTAKTTARQLLLKPSSVFKILFLFFSFGCMLTVPRVEMPSCSLELRSTADREFLYYLG
jgi:hypothetical protein